MQLRKQDLTWNVAGEDLVILDLEGSVYLKLNGSGRLLWELLSEPRDVDSLESALVAEYSIDRERAKTDVDAFLTDLRARGLLIE